MSMITATTWVPRGFAAQFPTKYEFNEEEYDRIQDLAKLRLDDAKEELEQAKTSNGASNGASSSKTNIEEDDDDLKEYDLDHYDDEPAEEDDEGQNGDTMGMFGNIKSLIYHGSNEDDPYITLRGEQEEDEERDELQILPTDNLVLATKTEDEVAYLEVQVYEDEADNLYVHHDIMLPAIPLCMEWLDLPVGRQTQEANGRGNFAAIGTMDPDIELWDLDIVDCMYPNAILGEGGKSSSNTSSKPKKKKRSKKPSRNHHVDAVLSLAANRHHRNLLASASADATVKLWDLNNADTSSCAQSYAHHTDRVCALAWHPQEASALLSGSYDRTVVAADMRSAEDSTEVRRWPVDTDVETLRWDPHDGNLFYVATESGLLHCFDARVVPSSQSSAGGKNDKNQSDGAVWRLQAHNKSLSALDVNAHVPGFFATGSADKTVKLWSVVEGTSGPTLVATRDLDVGRVFGLQFAPDEEVGFRLAVGGSKGAKGLQIWDTSTNAAVRRVFATRVPEARQGVEERLIGVESSEGEESGDDERG